LALTRLKAKPFDFGLGLGTYGLGLEGPGLGLGLDSCNSPGVAAPGISCIFSVTKLYCELVQPIGLVDYLSLKKSI